MARPGFFNDNENRTFPFREGTAGIDTPTSGAIWSLKQLPDDFIVDCGFILGPSSQFDAAKDSVFLHKISRSADDEILIEFRSDATMLQYTPLIFTRQPGDSKYKLEFQERDVPDYADPNEYHGCGNPSWEGYLVTGEISTLWDRLPPGAEIIRQGDDETVVEPALLQNLSNSQLTSLNIANLDRTRALRPEGCPPLEWEGVQDLYVYATCLTGDVRFANGYNLSLTQLTDDNTIRLAPVVNAGKGEPCEEIKYWPEEAPPAGATNNLLGGDFHCNEVLRTVNGLPGPNLTLFAGSGVSINAEPAEHTVRINIDLLALSACTYSEFSEVSESI